MAGAGAAIGLAVGSPVAGAAPARRSNGKRVAILGGGMAGLAAAHELIERGFEVTVFEPSALGGKARSMGVQGTGTGGRRDLPGEHGFRFFPGFYQHIPETMARIPFAGNANGVLDNLVGASAARLSMVGQPDLTAPMSIAGPLPMDFTNPDTLRSSLTAMFTLGSSLPPAEVGWFVDRLVVFLTSSIERRFGQWEYASWEETLRAEGKSAAYQSVLVSALTRQLVAAKPSMSSTRTIGTVGQAFVLNAAGIVPSYGAHADRLLSAPTNEAWIDPWVAHLSALGVRFEMGRTVAGLRMRSGQVAAAMTVDSGGARQEVEADWFVSAMPVERAVDLWTPEVLSVDPSLVQMRELVVDWMVGIQYFLRTPTPIAHGHLAYLGSPWALTSISQAQFWRSDFAATYGDGQARECLSVDISDWDTPGILYGNPARRCTREEIASETWAQMQRSLNDDGAETLRDEDLLSWFLDPGIAWNESRGENDNETPLLVNTVGSWDSRPHTRTAVPNLFLAGDYVRTNIDLATMEGANESARAAVNALLESADSTAAPCPMFTLHEPPELGPMRALDAARFKSGLPHLLDVG
ncbi:hydroxysqualene dehydroxylase [Tomitella biformata]|uniref:hydroxysqualene dehydroxylase n=1 Tax=Tomitella biformata TaxID=630403 RepID=UPI0009FFD0A3|nr:FAD-dependent oxidoreductase [Tomitella biformata]